jgi:uncharacterized repeat protein (TIGR01451 family)
VQLLDNGKVLISGGTSAGRLVTSAEVYDPVTGAFQPVDSPGTARRLFGANFFQLPYTGILLATGGLDSAQQPLASSEGFFYPTLRSDKPDYAPGETVTLMGEGWRPNEQVAINIRESSGDPDTNLTATADASGAFTNSEFRTNPDRSDVGVQFLATATGEASRWTAQTRFTDGNVVAKAAPSGVTFTLTKSKFSSNNSCSGSPDAGSPTIVTGVDNSTGNSTSASNGQSVRLQASATSDQGGAFLTWTSTSSFTFIDVNTICVAGFNPASASREYFANYSPAQADVKIDKVGPGQVDAGASFSYTLTVTNLGPSRATGIGVSDQPAGATATGVSASGGGFTSCSVNATNTATCTGGSLAKDAVATITLTVKAPDEGGSITNVATVSANEVDSNLANNTSAMVTTAVRAVADVKIDKVGPGQVDAGASFSYTLTVTNLGPSRATGIGVSDQPAGAMATGVSASGGGFTSCSVNATNTATCTGGSLAKDAVATITLTVKAPDEGGSITNVATVSANEVDSNLANNTSAMVTTAVRVPEVTIDPTVTTVSCNPPTVQVNQPTACTATVRDVVVGAPVTTPTGSVSFFADASTTAFASCTLQATATTGVASCSVAYRTSTVGAHNITASYPGDRTHEGSRSAAFTVTVVPGAPGLGL